MSDKVKFKVKPYAGVARPNCIDAVRNSMNFLRAAAGYTKRRKQKLCDLERSLGESGIRCLKKSQSAQSAG